MNCVGDNGFVVSSELETEKCDSNLRPLQSQLCASGVACGNKIHFFCFSNLFFDIKIDRS